MTRLLMLSAVLWAVGCSASAGRVLPDLASRPHRTDPKIPMAIDLFPSGIPAICRLPRRVTVKGLDLDADAYADCGCPESPPTPTGQLMEPVCPAAIVAYDPSTVLTISVEPRRLVLHPGERTHFHLAIANPGSVEAPLLVQQWGGSPIRIREWPRPNPCVTGTNGQRWPYMFMVPPGGEIREELSWEAVYSAWPTADDDCLHARRPLPTGRYGLDLILPVYVAKGQKEVKVDLDVVP